MTPNRVLKLGLRLSLAALATSATLGTLSAVGSAALQPQSSPAEAPLLAQEAILETVLFFETESMAVRIYRRGSSLFMNLYNKGTDTVEARNTPAELAPSTRDQTVYRNSLGEVDRLARVTVLGESSLEILAPDGEVLLQEAGYNTVVGVPAGETDFAGNNFAPGTSAVVLSARFANLRQNPDLQSPTVAAVPRRDTVDVVDRVGNPRDGFIWYQAIYNGQTGWVRGDLLQPI
ncbi:MAG TPA: SH3 domain-containing protein [Trichocoleus sp.]